MVQLITGIVLGSFLAIGSALLFLQIGLNINKSEGAKSIFTAIRPIRPASVTYTDEVALEQEEERIRKAKEETWEPGLEENDA